MYSLVPATVSMIMFFVLSPKSAILRSGIGCPLTYFLVSRIFYGLRSRWVIRWLWSSCTPLAICKIQFRVSSSVNLWFLTSLSASLRYDCCYHSEPPEQYSVRYQTNSAVSMISNISRILLLVTFCNSSLIFRSLRMSAISLSDFTTRLIAMYRFASSSYNL